MKKQIFRLLVVALASLLLKESFSFLTFASSNPLMGLDSFVEYYLDQEDNEEWGSLDELHLKNQTEISVNEENNASNITLSTLSAERDIAHYAVSAIANNEHSTHPGQNAIDGSLNSRWATQATVVNQPDWIGPITLELTFSEPQTVYSAAISSFLNRILDLSVEYYVVGEGWLEAVRHTRQLHGANPASAPIAIEFERAVTSDKFRLAIHDFITDPSIWAFQLFDTPPTGYRIETTNARVNTSPIGVGATLDFLEATSVNRSNNVGGRYTVTAAPAPQGYVFSHWEVEGLVVSDLRELGVGEHAWARDMTQTRFPFTMPDNDVFFIAHYEPHDADLRIGLMADIHIGQTRVLGAEFPNLHRVNSVFDWFTTQGLDGLAIAGDITRTSGAQQDFNSLRDSSRGRFSFPAAPDNNLPELMVGLGNHCSPSTGSMRLYNALGFGSNRAVIIDGYRFLTVGAGALVAGEDTNNPNGFHTAGNSAAHNYNSPQMRAWLRYHIDAAYEDGKPIFIFLHHAIQNTIYVSHEWNTNNFGSNVNNWYFRYDPHVVVFTGHTHSPNYDPRSIWQLPGGFTVVNIMSTEFLEMENRGTRNQQFLGNRNDGVGSSSRPRHYNRTDVSGIHVGAGLLEIRGTEVTIRNIDFSMENGLNDSVYEYENQVWTWDVFDTNDRPFTNDRFNQAQEPFFADDAQLWITNVTENNITVKFDQAIMPDYNPVNESVHSYRFRFYNTSTGVMEREAWQWSDFMYPTRRHDTFRQTIGNLRSGTEYRLVIHAYGSFQAESSNYLELIFTTDGTRDYRSYSLSFNGHLNNDTGRLPETVQVTSNLAGNLVEPRFESGSQSGRKAIRLDRENFINLGSEPHVFDYNNSFTIAFRINVLERTGNFGIILGNKNYASGGNNGFVFLVRNGQAPNGYILLNTTSGGNRLNGGNDIRIAYAHVGDNDIWIHIAVVYCFETNTVSYYADGERVGRRNHNLQAGMNGYRNTMIGQVTNGTALYANANNNSTFLMEDFLLTSGTFTSDEIYELANGQREEDAPAITTIRIPKGILGRSFSYELQATAYPQPIWSVANGELPTGLSLSSSGLLSGMPTESGNFTFTIRVENVIGYVEQEFNLTIEKNRSYDLSFDGHLNNAEGNFPESIRLYETSGGGANGPAVYRELGEAIFRSGSRPDREAIELHGRRFIDLGREAFDYTDSFTIGFRVNVLQTRGSSPALVSNKNWSAGANNGYVFMVRGGNIFLNTTSNGNRLGGAGDVLIASAQTGDNDVWIHITAVYDFNGGSNGLGSVTYYADGVRIGSRNHNLTTGMNGGQNTFIGQSFDSNSGAGALQLYNHTANRGDITFLMEDFFLVTGIMTDAEVYEIANPAQQIDRSALANAIAQAKILDASNFSDDSWSILGLALINGHAVYENPTATQEEVDMAYYSLRDAISQLEKISICPIENTHLGIIISTPSAGFHTGPGSINPRIEYLETSTQIRVIEVAENGNWLQICHEGREGYVSRGRIDIITIFDESRSGFISTTANLHAGPGSIHRAIKVNLDPGTPIEILGIAQNGNWYYVYMDGIYGFLSRGRTMQVGPTTKFDVPRLGVIATEAYLRQGPGSIHLPILNPDDPLSVGTEIQILGIAANGNWSLIQYGDYTGYVSRGRIDHITETEQRTVLLSSTNAELRAGPGSIHKFVIEGQLPAQTPVIIRGISQNGNWYYVRVGEHNGFISRGRVW